MNENKTEKKRTLKLKTPMMRGDDVFEFQSFCKKNKFYKGFVDGVFGKKSDTAARHFQSSCGLEIDGIVGGDTWDFISDDAGIENKSLIKHIIITIPHGGEYQIDPISVMEESETIYLQHGKQSVDGKIKEGIWIRKMIEELSCLLYNTSDDKLKNLNIHFIETGPISTTANYRANAVNMLADKLGGDHCCLAIEPHLNAAGDGTEWTKARGHKILHNDKYNAAILADDFDHLMIEHKPISSPSRGSEKRSLSFLNGCDCAAIVAEFDFMDNKEIAFKLEGAEFDHGEMLYKICGELLS